MRFDNKGHMVSLSLDVDELSPVMLRVADAMINNDTIHTHALYWLSTHKYSAYQKMMDSIDLTEARISMSRQHAEKLLTELSTALVELDKMEKGQ
jgi:hypothetical protein